MPTWNQLFEGYNQQQPENRIAWLASQLTAALQAISQDREDRNVVLYGSAFLQKQNVPSGHTSITFEDVNGLMAVLKGMDWDRGLTLVLHTPGGVTNATETIVDYLRAKFSDIEVIVPTFAMSAGTMISLASNRIVMARHSQLGPIDPQMPMVGGRSHSARAIVEQFKQAQREILADERLALSWAPIISANGPALLQEAENNLAYSEQMVARYLASYMFAGEADPEVRGADVAKYFNDNVIHKSHGRRIGIDEARSQGLDVSLLEDSQVLQEHVLTAYHLMTIFFEQTLITKMMWSGQGQQWVKNWNGAAPGK